jgi:uncharacterized membrane protein
MPTAGSLAGRARSRLDSLTPRRIWIVGAAGAFVTALLIPANVGMALRAAAAWDVATLALLGLPWWVIMRADPETTRRRAATADPGRVALLLSAVVASAVALATAVALFKAPGGAEPLADWLQVGLGLWALMSAWALLHTAYALHYAHLYYRAGNVSAADDIPDVLQFPGGPPAEMDFAYFAFTLGMTFQTSDVVIANGTMRRVVLAHAVLAFGFNTVIVALAVSVLGNFVN